MSQQAVPAPGFRQRGEEPQGPKPLNLRWGLTVLGLIIVAGFLVSRFWESRFHPAEPVAEQESASNGGSGNRGGTSDSQQALRTEFGSGDTSASPLTPITTANDEEQAAAARLQELQRIQQQVKEQIRALREQDAGYRAQRAVESVRLSRLRAMAEEGRSDLSALKTHLAAWTGTLTPLMTNDRGRAIASDPERLLLVATALDNPPATEEKISAWERNLEALLEPLQGSADEANLRLPEEFVSELNALLADIRKVREELARLRATLDTMLSQTGTDRLGSEGPTLREALELRRGEEAQRRMAAIAEAQRQVREEADRKLAEAEAARLEAENRVKLLESQARKEEAEAARQKAELLRRFEREWPRMQSYLVPFTSTGFTQPGGHGFERTTEKGPVSLGRLQGAGVLNRDLNSMKKLYYSTTANGMNDRDHGGFPRYFGGAQDWDRRHPTIQMIQDFLNEFGPILVEKGLLAP